jgi:hypothetical protein
MFSTCVGSNSVFWSVDKKLVIERGGFLFREPFGINNFSWLKFRLFGSKVNFLAAKILTEHFLKSIFPKETLTHLVSYMFKITWKQFIQN